jgi:hypothetical protein
MTNGVTKSAIGDHIWTNGTVTAESNITSEGNIQSLGNVEIGTYSSTNTGSLILNGSTANKHAVVKCTNGNLHLDAHNGHHVYLNYWSEGSLYLGKAGTSYLDNSGSLTVKNKITAKGNLYSENDLYLRTDQQRQVKIDSSISFADAATSCASGVHFKKTTSSPTIVAFGSHWNGAAESITNAFVVGTGSGWYNGQLLKLTGTGTLTVAGNIYANGSYYYGDNKRMFQFSDSWLRINESKNFTSGIFCGDGKLRTDGQFEVGGNGDKFKVTSAGVVTAAGTITGTDCIATSDSRVKDNIAIIEDASGKLDKLSGNTFNRVDMDGRLHAGVIAQEVQAVLPEAIFITDDEAMDDGKKLNVSTSAMIGLLVQGHKEQAKEIAELKAMVELLMGGK